MTRARKRASPRAAAVGGNGDRVPWRGGRVAARHIAVSSGPVAAVVQSIVQVRMRALAAAINLFATNLIGMGLGPQVVGLVSDALSARTGDWALRYGMLTVGLANLLAGAFYLLADRELSGTSSRSGPS